MMLTFLTLQQFQIYLTSPLNKNETIVVSSLELSCKLTLTLTIETLLTLTIETPLTPAIPTIQKLEIQ